MRLLISVTVLFASPLGLTADDFAESIRPLLQKYCVRCHKGEKPKGEFDLTRYDTLAAVQKDRIAWRKALTVVREDEMPPKKPLPSPAERRRLVEWIEHSTKIDWSKVRHPGHVTIPRLTRDEYNNTLRDLLGVDLQPGETFLEDGEGRSGFNTDRDALFVTPALMEKYFDAAERALIAVQAISRPIDVHLESEKMFMTETKETPKQFDQDFFGYVINRGQMTLYESVTFPADGYYTFRVRARSTAGPTGTRLRINDVTKGDIHVPSTAPEVFELTCFVAQGSHQIAWNIEKSARPPATVKPAPQKPNETQKKSEPEKKPESRKPYRKLPGDANAIVTREAMKNYPRYPVTGDEPGPVNALIKKVDNDAYSLQRPYEWLRLLDIDGDPNEIVRFKGYIADRTKVLEKTKNELSKALAESREAFGKRYEAANAERLADNKRLLERVVDVKPVPARKQQRKPSNAKQKPGSVAIDWIEVHGPVRPDGDDTELRIFAAAPGSGTTELEAATAMIADFTRRAFRRPVSNTEVGRFVELFSRADARGDSFEDATRLALTGVLVSPHFLFRSELGPGDDEFQLDNYQLASRLSYLFWMSMPDDELFQLAAGGKLSRPGILKQQVRRLIADPKARSLAQAFTGQWLGFASLGRSVMPDAKKFPQFTSELVDAMKLETVLSFESILRENRSVLELLDSTETWLNEPLAKHYEIKGIVGNEMRRVSLTNRHRGGLPGMASVLTATSSPTRTSPVIRGKWVLETLLGRHLPEPPADAGELPGNAGEARTLREELLLHRRDPTCAVCHDKIDPIGFGLENFDAIGRFRTKQAGKPIDSRGELPSGEAFDGPVELKEYLFNDHKTEFTRNLTKRLLSFALGRELQYFDEPVIEKIVSAVEADDYRSHTLLNQIVLSYPFRYQAGKHPVESP